MKPLPDGVGAFWFPTVVSLFRRDANSPAGHPPTTRVPQSGALLLYQSPSITTFSYLLHLVLCLNHLKEMLHTKNSGQAIGTIFANTTM